MDKGREGGREATREAGCATREGGEERRSEKDRGRSADGKRELTLLPLPLLPCFCGRGSCERGGGREGGREEGRRKEEVAR